MAADFSISVSSAGLKRKSFKYWTGEKDLFHWPVLHEAQKLLQPVAGWVPAGLVRADSTPKDMISL
jgi:hypothetical protein